MDTPKGGIPLEGCVGQESLDGEGALFSSHNMAFNILGRGDSADTWKYFEL